jgi:uncharacterized protein (TIGR02271 family)
MATIKKTVRKTGDANPDPITGEKGAHPVGVGLGTAAGGAAAGAAAGMVAGPIGAVAGAVIGGIAGGLAGKGIAEIVDPTEEEKYWRKTYKTRPYVTKGTSYTAYQPAYRYGVESSLRHTGKTFEDVESSLSRGWRKARGESPMAWDQAKPAVQDAYDRVIQLREEQLRVRKEPVQKGEVRVRKEVVSEMQHLDVPVEREEVVIERRPARRQASSADLKAEEIRIPVKEEKVRVRKEPVVVEEVNVRKRKVQETRRVADNVRKERLKVDEEGDVKVRGGTTTTRSRNR